MQTMNCPSCGAGLEDTRGKAHVVCRFCGTESKLVISPVESFQRHFERKQRVQPLMDRLMERYADLLGRGEKKSALLHYEAFSYLVMWTAQDVDGLGTLEAMVTPMMHDAARQLGLTYIPPVDRGEQVSFGSVEALLEE